MAHEQNLLTAFIEFADTITDEYDVVEFLQRLAERCVEVTNATAVGIMLADQHAALRYVASSSEQMRLVELFELQHDEGPCLDAFRAGTAVHSILSDDANRRWPHFTSRAQAAGFEAVSALPMRLRDEMIGALNVFSSEPALLSPNDRMVAQALADIATIGILQERALSDALIVTSQLSAALESRIVIEQAKGFVSEREQISIDDAFAFLRAYARSHNARLSQVAQDVIDGTLATAQLSTKRTHKAGREGESDPAPSPSRGSIRVRTVPVRSDPFASGRDNANADENRHHQAQLEPAEPVRVPRPRRQHELRPRRTHPSCPPYRRSRTLSTLRRESDRAPLRRVSSNPVA